MTTEQPSNEPSRTTKLMTASENKSLDVVVSAPAQMTDKPVAPSSDAQPERTPPAEVSD
ncbi:MAG: hypothetical protein L0H96_20590 [Humibacillus sp.]|nr:hypothetical protein [Humibacillus sp.]